MSGNEGTMDVAGRDGLHILEGESWGHHFSCQVVGRRGGVRRNEERKICTGHYYKLTVGWEVSSVNT